VVSTLIGVNYDVNVYKRPASYTFDNLSYNLAFENFSQNNERSRDGKYREGGPWLMNKLHVSKKPSQSVTAYWGQFPVYAGSMTAPVPEPPPAFIIDDLWGYGSELYDSAKPDKPYMGLANAIYELKDLSSMVSGLKNQFNVSGLKDIANFNLAVNFGWLPLLSDCRKLYESQTGIQRSLERLVRNNGRPIRRNIPVDNKYAETSFDVLDEYDGRPPGMSNPTLVTQAYASDFHHRITHRWKKRIWFSGEFVYWLPNRNDYPGMSERAWRSWMVRRLYGLRPTPSVIYKAIPWSWLLDWATNTGSILSNLEPSVAERLVSNYAYTMRSIESENTHAVSGNISGFGGHPVPVSASTSIARIWKERIYCYPFGFRLKTEDLSPFQLSILGSIAASKGR
jgi:hypothetical protein